MKRIVLMQVVTALILAAAITAAVPQMINYQGRLTDPSGVPLDTTVSITFTIYDDSAAGSVIWTETQSSVTTTDGLFSVLLGSVNPISDTVFSDTVRYLGIKVGSDLELSPRRRIASVAYAHRSSQISTVDGAAGGVINGDLTINGGLTIGGDDTSGNVGKDRPAPGELTVGNANFPGFIHILNTFDADTIVLIGATARVGIGTDVPLATLSLGLNQLNLDPFDTSSNFSWADPDEFSSPSTIKGTGSIVIDFDVDQNSTDQIFAISHDSGQEVFRIEDNGNVGIGTSTPAEKLDVAGTVQMTGFKMPTGATNDYVLTSNAEGLGTWKSLPAGADNDWELRTPGTDVLFTIGAWGIARDGNTLFGTQDSTHVNLGVNSTTGSSGQNWAFATVSGGYQNISRHVASTVGGGRFNTANGDYSFAAGWKAKANHHGTFVWADNSNADFSSSANAQFLIRASGGVGIGTNAPSVALHVVGSICYTGTSGLCSDKRFKKDVETITGALDRVTELRGIEFNWKRDEFPEHQFPEGKQTGFIAQELRQVLPDVVSQGTDGFYSVDYGRLTPVLVEAIKELSAENESLRSQIETTNTKLGKLTKTVELILAAQKKSAGDKLALGR